MSQSQLQTLPAGALIAVYEIKEVIHCDSACITYRAWNQHLNMLVVITEYFPIAHAVRHANSAGVKPKSGADQALFDAGLTHFLEQSEILASIQYPGIIDVHNVLRFNGTVYRVKEDYQGISLAEWLKISKPIEAHKFTELLRALLHSLQILHEKGVVQGDIHASNILIGSNDTPVLINNAATRLKLAADNDTLLQELRCGYAPVELYSRDNSADAISDYYALGALMYACVTHIEPASALDRAQALNNGQPDPLQPCLNLTNTGYKESFLTAIDSMLNPDRTARPQSAQAVLDLLDEHSEAAQNSQEILQSKRSPINIKFVCIGVCSAAILVIFGLWSSGTDKQPVKPISKEFQASNMFAKKTGNSETTTGISDQEPDSTRVDPTAAAIITKTTQNSQPATELPEKITVVSNATEQSVIGVKPENRSTSSKQLSTLAILDTQAKSQKDAKVADPALRLEQHFSAAEKNIAAMKFSTPPGDNAYYHYQAILKIQPDNAQAHAGLKRIVDIYTWLVGNEIQKKHLRTAWVYLIRAENIMPITAELRRLRSVLVKAEKN